MAASTAAASRPPPAISGSLPSTAREPRAYWRRSEPRTRPRVTALREHGANRSVARARAGPHGAACTPRQSPSAFTTAAVGNKPGRGHIHPATARAERRVSTAAARLGQRPANRNTRTTNPATRSNSSRPHSARSDPSTSAKRTASRRVRQSVAAKTRLATTRQARDHGHVSPIAIPPARAVVVVGLSRSPTKRAARPIQEQRASTTHQLTRHRCLALARCRTSAAAQPSSWHGCRQLATR